MEMSWYVKISYPSSGSNQALIRSIKYIGKYYNPKSGDYYLDGIKFLKKRVRGASLRSIKFMVEQRKIKNTSKIRQWCFKYRVYRRLYSYIVTCMTNKKYGNEIEAKEILHSLYISQKQKNKEIEKYMSNILAAEEKVVLEWARPLEQYSIHKKEIEEILKNFDECDEKFVGQIRG